MSRVVPLFTLIRIHNLMIAMLVIIESAYLLSDAISFKIFFLIIAILSFMAFGYIINDVLDQKIDSTNNKKRPLTTNLITKKNAIKLSYCFVLLGIGSSFFLNTYTQSIILFLLLPLLSLYNYYFKRYFLLGNLIVSFLLGMVFIITEIEILQTYHTLLPIAYLAFHLNLIREIIKDIADYVGDLQAKMTTIPIILGEKLSIVLLRILIILFLLFSPIYVCSLITHSTTLIFLFILLIEFPLLYSLFLLRRLPSKKTIYNLSKLYKIIFLNGLIIIPMMKG